MSFQIIHFKSLAEFAEHLAGTRPFHGAIGVCVHHTESPTASEWRGLSSMVALKNFYQNEKGWKAGPHLFLAPDGIWQLVPLSEQGIHAVGANQTFFGIEVVGNFNTAPMPISAETLLVHVKFEMLSWLGYSSATNANDKAHRDFNKDSCPGAHVSMDVLRQKVNALFHNALITPQTKLISESRISVETAVRAFQQYHTISAVQQGIPIQYANDDIRQIVSFYVEQITSVRLDEERTLNWHVVLGQLSLETYWLSNWWAARPRRNPGGIGVNGMTSKEPQLPEDMWHKNPAGIYEHGNAYPSWRAASIPAHVGRLWGYVLPVGVGNRLVNGLIQFATMDRVIPKEIRGSCAVLADLKGRWAMDPLYAEKVAERANRMTEVKQ